MSKSDSQRLRAEALAWHARADMLEQKLLELTHALQWYADPTNYFHSIPGSKFPIESARAFTRYSFIYDSENKPVAVWRPDEGQRARDAITKASGSSNNNH